jgi:hypothetical protein
VAEPKLDFWRTKQVNDERPQRCSARENGLSAAERCFGCTKGSHRLPQWLSSRPAAGLAMAAKEKPVARTDEILASLLLS